MMLDKVLNLFNQNIPLCSSPLIILYLCTLNNKIAFMSCKYVMKSASEF